MSITETADNQGFSHTTVFRVYREWGKKLKTSSKQQFCGQKRFVDERGQNGQTATNSNSHALQQRYALCASLNTHLKS